MKTVESLLPWFSIISTIIAVAGFVITNIRSSKATIKAQTASDIERATQQEKILASINNLASKEYLDQRLKEELGSVELTVKEQIDDLRTDMKEQMNELKQDFKAQQEITQGMGKDVVRAVEGSDFAHKRIDGMDKRIDDLKEIFLSTQKKA